MFEVARVINYRKVRHPAQLIPDIVACVQSEKQIVDRLTNQYEHARRAYDAEVAVANRAEDIRQRTGEDLAAVQAAEILLRDELKSECDAFTENHERLTLECAQQDDRISRLRLELLQSAAGGAQSDLREEIQTGLE